VLYIDPRSFTRNRKSEEFRRAASARSGGRPKRVGVVAAEDEVALSAAEAALELGIAVPVLIGNERKSGEKAEALRLSGLLTKAEFVNTDHPAPAAAR